jgi:hypothetical protein
MHHHDREGNNLSGTSGCGDHWSVQQPEIKSHSDMEGIIKGATGLPAVRPSSSYEIYQESAWVKYNEKRKPATTEAPCAARQPHTPGGDGDHWQKKKLYEYGPPLEVVCVFKIWKFPTPSNPKYKSYSFSYGY